MPETILILLIGIVLGYAYRSIPDWISESETRKAEDGKRRVLLVELETLRQKAKDEGRFVPNFFNKH